MGQYEKALQDADVSISLAPDWPKGYFRRGRALAGLKVHHNIVMLVCSVVLLILYSGSLEQNLVHWTWYKLTSHKVLKSERSELQ